MRNKETKQLSEEERAVMFVAKLFWLPQQIARLETQIASLENQLAGLAAYLSSMDRMLSGLVLRSEQIMADQVQQKELPRRTEAILQTLTEARRMLDELTQPIVNNGE